MIEPLAKNSFCIFPEISRHHNHSAMNYLGFFKLVKNVLHFLQCRLWSTWDLKWRERYSSSIWCFKVVGMLLVYSSIRFGEFNMNSSKTGNSQKNILLSVINFGESRHFSHDRSSPVITCRQLGHPSRQLIL